MARQCWTSSWRNQKTSHTKLGTPVAVFRTSQAWISKPHYTFGGGDRIRLHGRMLILSRFMERWR